jgi:hypothetical protein
MMKKVKGEQKMVDGDWDPFMYPQLSILSLKRRVMLLGNEIAKIS